MRPAVEVREKHDATRGRPVQVCLAFSGRWRAAQRKRAVPELLTFAARGVRGPDGPCLRTSLERRLRRAAASGPPHECDALTVRRPTWTAVSRSRRREIDDRRLVVSVDADERVIAAIGNEGEPRAVRGPLGRTAVAARVEISFALGRAVDRC